MTTITTLEVSATLVLITFFLSNPRARLLMWKAANNCIKVFSKDAAELSLLRPIFAIAIIVGAFFPLTTWIITLIL